MDLFTPIIIVPDTSPSQGEEAEVRPDAPLAARMRPCSLEELAGQAHLLAAGKSLRQAIASDELRSAIFWGPPGCGKSTLASLIARTTRCHFESFSAVTGGVADVRKLIEAARERRKAYGQRTLLFVDEIHRFNKAQQDAFLPHVEDGTVILIGATTENPYFSVNAPLLSRAHLYPFQALSEDELTTLILRALTDTERGLGERQLTLEPQALGFLAAAASGDARSALGALELAATLAESGIITLAHIEEAVGQRAIGYDKAGNMHYDMASALIKSIRGSDPDAAIYYLTRMLEAGEEPRFLARRLVILASEDIGCADPAALPLAMAGFQAVEAIGMPECALNLAHVTLYLAAAPKSNACSMALGRARDDVRNAAFSGIPKPLRDSHGKGVRALGHGVGYLSPHDFPEGFVRQRHLPEGLPVKDELYYQPTENGVEAKIKARLARLWSESGDEAH